MLHTRMWKRVFIGVPLPATHERFVQQATEYHLFMFLKEYYGKLKDLRVDSRHALDAAHIG